MAFLLSGSFSNLAHIEQPKFQSPRPTDLEGMKEVYELVVDYPIRWDTHISVIWSNIQKSNWTFRSKFFKHINIDGQTDAKFGFLVNEYTLFFTKFFHKCNYYHIWSVNIQENLLLASNDHTDFFAGQVWQLKHFQRYWWYKIIILKYVSEKNIYLFSGRLFFLFFKAFHFLHQQFGNNFCFMAVNLLSQNIFLWKQSKKE